ncbi:Uncharacterised protein [Mycobacteroides abscessus subsp. abscessus]|nr:Uncharacterised protein [Mycobacteroides abscessus subsp. abscessus]
MVNRWASTQSCAVRAAYGHHVWHVEFTPNVNAGRHHRYTVSSTTSNAMALTANQLRILEALQRLRIARTEGDLHEEMVSTRRMDYLLDRVPLSG